MPEFSALPQEAVTRTHTTDPSECFLKLKTILDKGSDRDIEADLAQRRYLHIGPANRLVVDLLGPDWNEKLRASTRAQERYEQRRQQDPVGDKSLPQSEFVSESQYFF